MLLEHNVEAFKSINFNTKYPISVYQITKREMGVPANWEIAITLTLATGIHSSMLRFNNLSTFLRAEKFQWNK